MFIVLGRAQQWQTSLLVQVAESRKLQQDGADSSSLHCANANRQKPRVSCHFFVCAIAQLFKAAPEVNQKCTAEARGGSHTCTHTNTALFCRRSRPEPHRRRHCHFRRQRLQPSERPAGRRPVPSHRSEQVVTSVFVCAAVARPRRSTLLKWLRAVFFFCFFPSVVCHCGFATCTARVSTKVCKKSDTHLIV